MQSLKSFAVLICVLVAFSDANPRRGSRGNFRGRGRRGGFLAKFYDDSCQATCPEGQKAFSLLTTSENACPDDFSDKAALRATFVRPKDFCAAENNRVCTYCFTKVRGSPPTVESYQTCTLGDKSACAKPRDLKNITCTCA